MLSNYIIMNLLSLIRIYIRIIYLKYINYLQINHFGSF